MELGCKLNDKNVKALGNGLSSQVDNELGMVLPTNADKLDLDHWNRIKSEVPSLEPLKVLFKSCRLTYQFY